MAKKPKEETIVVLPPKNEDVVILPTLAQILLILGKDEVVENRPTANGLRRVIREYTPFEISSTTVDVLQCPTKDNDWRATVRCTIEYTKKSPPVDGDDFEELLIPYRVSDVSDCYYGNTKAPYNKFPTATASTMAEGRCLRKILCLNTLTAEENLEQDPAVAKQIEDDQASQIPITEVQKAAIQNLAKIRGVDFTKILPAHEKRDVPEDLSHWCSRDAQDTLVYLHKYGKRPEEKTYILIPDNVKVGYVETKPVAPVTPPVTTEVPPKDA
jgi:hypothetical protein